MKGLLPENLSGLKVQRLSNDPENRLAVDGSDIQRRLRLHRGRDDTIDFISENLELAASSPSRITRLPGAQL